MRSVKDTVKSLQELSYPSHRYQLFVTFLNKELARSDDELYGMIMHVGSYSTKEKAQEARIKICSVARGPAVYMCTSGCPVPLELANKDAIVFGADINATSEQLEKAAREAIKDREKEAASEHENEEDELRDIDEQIEELSARRDSILRRRMRK